MAAAIAIRGAGVGNHQSLAFLGSESLEGLLLWRTQHAETYFVVAREQRDGRLFWGEKVHALTDLGKADNVVDALFGLEMEEEFKCEESDESKVSKSTAKKLVCNIQGGAGASTQARSTGGGGGGGRAGGAKIGAEGYK